MRDGAWLLGHGHRQTGLWSESCGGQLLFGHLRSETGSVDDWKLTPESFYSFLAGDGKAGGDSSGAEQWGGRTAALFLPGVGWEGPSGDEGLTLVAEALEPRVSSGRRARERAGLADRGPAGPAGHLGQVLTYIRVSLDA